MDYQTLAYSFPLLTVTPWLIAVVIWAAIAFWPTNSVARKGRRLMGVTQPAFLPVRP